MQWTVAERFCLRSTLLALARTTLILAPILALSACGDGGIARLFKSERPAEVCAAPDTHATIQAIIEENDEKLLSASGLPADDVAKLKQLMARIWAGGGAKFDRVTLLSVDETTKKISCEGTFVVTLPASSIGARHASKPFLEHRVGFSRQPSADGETYVYQLDDPREAATVLAAAVATFRIEAAAQAMRAEETTAEDADVEGSGETYEEFIAKFDSPSACHEAATNSDQSLMCSRMAKDESFARVDRAFAGAMARLGDEDGKALMAAQSLWQTKRDDECEAEALAAGGHFSVYATVSDTCLIERSDLRAKELDQLGRTP